MTRIEALTELRDKLEAGEWWEALARSCFPLPQHTQLLFKANCGSLDAALAMHEAVLPGWFWRIQNDVDGAFVVRVQTMTDVGSGGIDRDPARAWLIAILKAKIAEDE